jgi:glycosyltransferase involved in cell wall biosynthesis
MSRPVPRSLREGDPEPESSREGITVVIPTKDRAELLRQTLRSLEEQTLPATELLIADDGSTDETEQLVHAAGARYLRNPGGGWGAAGARNAGLRAAQCRYVAFLDSDDLLHPRALERLHAALAARPQAPFAFGNALAAFRDDASGWISEGLIGPSGFELRDFLCNLYARNSVPSGGVLVHRELALELGGFDTRIVFIEDHAFWLSLARRGEPVYVPEVVCIHRRHTGNRMSPAVATGDDRFITDLAREDDRLVPCMPRRRGVQLCDISVDAFHRRSPRELSAAVMRLLVRGPGRLQVLRAAGQHFRMRRFSAAAGAALLEGDGELRDWLATY